MSEAGKIIKYLRKRIPTFECIPGCSDCCGPISFSKWEWAQISDKREASSLTCPYVTKEGCVIYSQRPIMCRLFGTVPKMLCPHGCRPKKMLSSKKDRELFILYLKLIKSEEAQ